MAKGNTRGNTFGLTLHIPNEFRDDLKLLSRYNYTSVSAEIITAIREHLEKNKELIDREKSELQA